MGMIRPGFLSAEQRVSLDKLVRQTSLAHGAAHRAKALLLLDDGLSCEAIARVLYIDDDRLRGWHEGWIAGGKAALTSFDFKGAKRSLDASQEAALIEDLRARLSPPRARFAPISGRDVKAWLARDGCRVRLYFLPPYASNLNAIERLWGEMHRCVTHNKRDASEMEFVQAIHGFFTVTLPKHWKSIRDTVSDNFHIIRPDDFRVVR
jgi:hypothetical protein